MTYNPKTSASEEFVYRVVNESRTETNERFDNMENKMDKRFDMVMNTLDKVLKYFKKFNETQEILSHRTYENIDRIEKLEKAVFKTS